MGQLRDITSTEKLLRVIRSKNDEAPTGADAPEPLVKKTTRFRLPKAALPNMVTLQKTSTVGIDIGHEHLRMVRATANSDRSWRILDRRKLALPPKLVRDTPEFQAFLKTSLASFCGSTKQSNLWAIMSTAKVDVHHIRVPKVAKKQLDNVVYWTAKKESPFDEKEMVFDFEFQGEVIEQGIPKLAVMVYTAPRQEIDDLKGLFMRIGWPLTGISVVPFAVQNLFRTSWLPSQEGTIASLFIGNDFSRIDIYAGGSLVMTRGIKAGMTSMVEALVDRFNEMRTSPNAPSLTMDQGRKIIWGLSPDSPPLEKGDAGSELSKETVFGMLEPALERLARQVERTFEHYTSTMPGDRIVRVFVSGAMNIYQPIVDYVGMQLGVKSAILDPLSEQASAAGPDVDGALCVSERIAFAPAVGLALSGNDHTPNLMFTYKDKKRETSIKRINQTVFALFMAIVLICSAAFVYQNHVISQRRTVVAGLEAQLTELAPPVDRNQVLKLAAKVKQRNELSKVYADRYLGMVLISELTALTPARIRFVDLKITLGPALAGDSAKKETAKPRAEEIILEGLILGDRQMFETSLASYTMSLEASPLFRQVTVQKNNVEPYLKDEALHFILNIKVEEQVHG